MSGKYIRYDPGSDGPSESPVWYGENGGGRMNYMEGLDNLRKVAESVLPTGFSILDIVYRDIDCGVFGSKGYSLVVKYPSGDIRGFNFKNPVDVGVHNWLKTRIDEDGKVE